MNRFDAMCHAYQNYVNLNMPDSGTRKEYLTTGLKDFEKEQMTHMYQKTLRTK